MNDINGTALARLRAADPAVAVPDARSPFARAMLERVLTADDGAPAPQGRFRPARRGLAIGAAGAAAIVAASALAVTAPWPSGQAASAYTVDKNSDGSIRVSIRPAQLKDPDKLNAELVRAGANTVAMGMVPADRCPTQPAIDPAFQVIKAHSADELAARMAKFPVSYEMRGDGVLIVIQPKKIPAGDTLVIGYAFFDGRDGPVSFVRPVVVTAVPSCLAGPTADTLPTPDSEQRQPPN